jgi:SET domain-containing protein
MKNIALKTNDVTNIVHLHCFHTYNTRTTKKHKKLEHLAPVSPTIIFQINAVELSGLYSFCMKKHF